MVSDAFDAMTSTRSYRPARTVDKAVAELRRCQGDQFDPAMVDALVGAIGKHGWEGDPEPFIPAQVVATETTVDAAAELPAARV
jgi:HD-GYP domain-containing protein (c-di-GMP phosphodiesterase class II)